MSHDDHLRERTQEDLRNNPHTQQKTEQEVRNSHDREVINAEIARHQDRQRQS